jgi:parallel beta-helix repeat protein
MQNNLRAINVYLSSNNTIFSNTLSDNYEGLSFTSSVSTNNVVYHNNLDNTYQTRSEAKNFWSYANEGNYWSNYMGQDLNADGIADSAYVIDRNNQDDYPLMGRFFGFEVVWKAKMYTVAIVSNSTISDFGFEIGEETGNKIIQFNTMGGGLVGFTRVMIPIALMDYPYIVLTDGKTVTPTLLSISDPLRAYLYFTYSDTNSTVRIVSSQTMHLYYELLARYADLQILLADLNATYLDLSSVFAALLSNYSQLVDSTEALNSSYQQHLLEYSQQLQNIRSLTYIFVATTAVLIITTIYLSRHAHAKAPTGSRPFEEEKEAQD